MDTFFSSNPGMASRIAHHIDFPDYDEAELMQIARLMLDKLNYRFDEAEAEAGFARYVQLRRAQPHFANGARSAMRSIASGCARRRGCSPATPRSAATSLVTLRAEDILSSRVFNQGKEPA